MRDTEANKTLRQREPASHEEVLQRLEQRVGSYRSSLSGIEMASLGLNDVRCEIEHVLRQLSDRECLRNKTVHRELRMDSAA